MINHITPVYLSSLIPAQVSSASRYNLQNAHNYQTIRARTNQYRDAFLPSTLHIWNNLPLEARQSNSLNSFKHFLKNILPIPRYYYHGNRKPQILHSRLQTGCSALNFDLFTKTITVSPLCCCGTIGNSQHYFFHYRNYQAIRHGLLNSISLIQNPSLQIFFIVTKLCLKKMTGVYLTICTTINYGAQWLSGRVLDSRPRGRGFEPHRRHCDVSLSKTH